MEIYKVSPNFTTDKLKTDSLDDKFDVFEDQMQGWFFDHARALTQTPKGEHSGFVILMISISYIEAIAAYMQGEEIGRAHV